jgi:hypothetical protein
MSDEQQACVMPDGWRGRWVRLRNFSLENWVYHLLSEKWCGNDMVPLDHRALYVDDKGKCWREREVHSDSLTPYGKDRMSVMNVFCFLNDSFDIGVGSPSRWHCMIRREAMNKFVWWYLRQRIFGEWCGLRRWAWYKLLFRRVYKSRMRAGLSTYEVRR